MKVLVTGATGFIGREIVSELSKNNFEVFGLARPKSKGKKIVPESEAKIILADITDSRGVKRLEKIGKIDVLIHSAGLAHQFGDTKKEEFDSVNVEGTRNVANLAVSLAARHFILISSTAVYGIAQARVGGQPTNLQVATAFDENSPINPETLYAQSKLKAEKVCRQICESNNTPLTIFRLSPVVGEANVGNVARLISAIDKGRFVWIGDGENLKSLIYKTDVARACLALAKNKNGQTEIFNLAAEPVMMKNFVIEIAEHLNKQIYKFSIPKNYIRSIFRINSNFVRSKKIYKIEATVEKWLSDDVYSAKKIREKYGFAAQTTVSEAIERQIRWYKKSRE